MNDERIKNKNGLVKQAVFYLTKGNVESGQLSPSPRQSSAREGLGEKRRVHHIHMAKHRVTGAAPRQSEEIRRKSCFRGL